MDKAITICIYLVFYAMGLLVLLAIVRAMVG